MKPNFRYMLKERILACLDSCKVDLKKRHIRRHYSPKL
jgi:hypothetical protein